MRINVKVDTSGLDRMAKNFEKNLAYSTAQAIDDTAKEAQRQIRDHMAQVFHVRSARTKQLLDRSIKIMQFATGRKGSQLYAIIGVDNSKERLMVSLFEEGGSRLPFTPGARREAIPIIGSGGARPSWDARIKSGYTISSLNMTKMPLPTRSKLSSEPRNVRRRKGPNSAHLVWQGRAKTFMLDSTKRAPYGGIFQRVARGRDDGSIKMLYSFRPNVKVKPVLQFVDTVGRAWDQRFGFYFDKRFFRLKGLA